jgi:hypothetical protein
MKEIALVVIVPLVLHLSSSESLAQMRTGDSVRVAVTARVSKSNGDTLCYRYVVNVESDSPQKLVGLTLELGLRQQSDKGVFLIDSAVNRYWGGSIEFGGERPSLFAGGDVAWVPLDTLANLADQLNAPVSAVGPGDSLLVSLRSIALPGINRFWAEGWHSPTSEQEYDSLLTSGFSPDEILKPWYLDAYEGITVTPVIPFLPLNAVSSLDTLKSYTTQSRSLGWISSRSTADKYLGYFSSARANLVQGDSVGARTPLQQVLHDVDIDSTANLTSEAYALIRYNTEYVLNQLPAGQEGVAPYSLFAMHSMWLRENSKVYSGNVGVDSVGSPPFLDSQVELSIGQGVTIASGSTIKAHRIKVKQGAVVNGDVYYNELDNNGAITGSQQTPLSLPLVASLPEFEASTPGTQNISVAQNGSQTLAPGSYGDIEVKKNGRLTLTGGTYHLSSITAGEDTRILVQSTSEIRIADKLSSGEGTYIGPEDTTRLGANEIKFYVGGINGKTGTLGADPKAAKIGMRNTVKAMFYVPNGTLWIREGSEVQGSFIGKDVEVGIGVKVWWKSGF